MERLEAAAPKHEPESWLYVPYDQLSAEIGPMARVEDPGTLGLVFIESAHKASRRPYHKQKLAWVLANQRTFALERAEAGHPVRYLAGDAPYAEVLDGFAAPLVCMEPAERELRVELSPLVEAGRLRFVEHEGWLTTPEVFAASQTSDSYRADAFYRAARRATGVLMADGKPAGGKYSFDSENRKKYTGDPPIPTLPRFEVSAITAEVGSLIEAKFGDHPGRLDLGAIPTTIADHEHQWRWFLDEAAANFGPFQDAMTTADTNLFHSRISASLHLHRILPRRVVDDVAAADLPIASKEGFIRQVLGWREFVRHVHRETDGFRVGCTNNALAAERPLPAAYWGQTSGLRCLDEVVRAVWDEGHGHHITRLMVLSNVATLLGVSPRELTDWFWVAYVDAYDWVVEPNVLGMGTFAVGDKMTTKPYVSGSSYIQKMSDYCGGCAYDPKSTCPIRSLYWTFLERNEGVLGDNPRLRMPYASLRKMAADKRAEHRRVSQETIERLAPLE